MKQTKDLVAELQKCGVRAARYNRGPLGENTFALTILPRHREGVVTVHQNKDAVVRVSGDKSRRQAVVSVLEGGRTVTRTVNASMGNLSIGVKPDREEIEKALRAKFPVIIPGNARWEVGDVQLHEQKLYRDQYGSSTDDTTGEHYRSGWSATGVVTATVRGGTTSNFLIGMDETRNFIAPLARPARTVKEAHAMLKPRSLRTKNWKRQGEWFFVPCAEKMKVKLIRMMKRSGWDRMRSYNLGGRYGFGQTPTTHEAQSALRVGNKIYARGFITDSRAGHHKALFLQDWHAVRRNREAVLKVSREQRNLLQRRRATWD